MYAPLFTVTAAAEERLRAVRHVPEMEAGICRALGYTTTKGGELTEEFSGEHFFIGFHSGAVWASTHPDAVRVTIAGRQFWLTSAVAESLRNKELALVSKEVGVGSHSGIVRSMLVALNLRPSQA